MKCLSCGEKEIVRGNFCGGSDCLNHKRTLPQESYIAVLKRQRKRIEEGLPLNLEDSNQRGNKYTEASWGLCSEEKEVWPHDKDHKWPKSFREKGRVAPLTREEDQYCPFDRRGAGEKGAFRNGCFYTCRLFRPKGDKPGRETALELYDEAIARAEKG